MESSSRLRPYADSNSSVRVTFQKGEKVEAIWSTDGQRYPGTIVHVYPNDFYEILFNDGVKTRKKANQIFKLKKKPVRPVSSSSSSKNLPPALAQVPSTVTTSTNKSITSKPLPGLIPANKSSPVANQPVEGANSSPQPPSSAPRLISSLTSHDDEKVEDTTNNANASSSSASNSPQPLPILLEEEGCSSSAAIEKQDHATKANSTTISLNIPNNPYKSQDLTKIPHSAAAAIKASTIDEVPPVLASDPIVENSDTTTCDASLSVKMGESMGDDGADGQASGAKRGFVYVKQPHYSVFDLPPTDLGKRRRRVHNYSMLARGPSLKGTKSLLDAEGDEIDGESATTTRSNSPASPAPPLLINCNSSPTKSTPQEKSKPSTPTAATTTTPTVPNSSIGFTRRRRFLTSPPKSSDKAVIFSSNKITPTVNVKVEEKSSNSRNSSSSSIDSGSIDKKVGSIVSSSNKVTNSSETKSLPTTNNRVNSNNLSSSSKLSTVRDAGSTVTSSLLKKGEAKSTIPSSGGRVRATNKMTVAAVVAESTTHPTTPPEQVNSTLTAGDGDVIPAKRLRRPTFKLFSEDEGYVDILSSRRQRRERRSIPVAVPEVKPDNRRPRARASLPVRTNLRELLPPPPCLDLEAPIPPATTKSDSTAARKLNNTDSLKIRPQESRTSTVPARTSDTIYSGRTRIRKDTNSLGEVESESEEEELLDVDEYTVLNPDAFKKSHRKRTTPHSSPKKTISASNSTTASDVDLSKRPSTSSRVNESSPVVGECSVAATAPLDSSPTDDLLSKPNTNQSLAQSRVLRRRCANRRWTMPSRGLGSTQSPTSLPSVVLDRLPISQVQIRVKKCDSVPQTPTSSSAPSESESAQHSKDTLVESSTCSGVGKKLSNDGTVVNESLLQADVNSTWKPHKKKRWGESKNRWTKPRNKIGLLPNVRPGIRVNESLSMQLLKRSRLQRRYEKRGRPKVALLTGITKKKLRKIQDSIQRRKLKMKQIKAYTKFKDVRVDIINCICGRTDEFGLMVQCEVCLCWQHGLCFDILNGAMLPRFYVCQSCSSPKSVRPSRLCEGIRQEMYKKGVLPSFPFAPKPSKKSEKFLQTCNDLTKVVDGIDDIIRQNRIKEHIALSEPENPKLYQWSTPRATPKDRVQKWYFNKYFRSILRRLILRNRKKPDYVETLRNVVLFREKLKTYSQAFEEAKSAISRKIGPRALILIEKLSEQQKQLDKIEKLKTIDFDENKPLESTKKAKGTVSDKPEVEEPATRVEEFPPPPPPPSPKDVEEKLTGDGKTPVGGSSTPTRDKRKIPGGKSRLEKLISSAGDILQILETSSESEDSSSCESESDSSEDDNDEIGESLTQKDEVPAPETGPLVQSWEDVLASKGDQDMKPTTDILLNVKDEAGPTAVITTSTVNIASIPIQKSKKVRVPSNVIEEVVEPNLKQQREKTKDSIQVLSWETKSEAGEELITGDIESESGETLSGPSTVSAEDSQGGEDFWYNPITVLNSGYDDIRQLLLKDTLLEDERGADLTWKPTYEDIPAKDWQLDIDTTLGLDDDSETDSLELEWSSDSELDLEEDAPEKDGTSDTSREITSQQNDNEADWQKFTSDILNTMNGNAEEEVDDTDDPDWVLDKAEMSSDSDMDDDVLVTSEPTVVYRSKQSCSKNGLRKRKSAGSTTGVVLVTSEPDVKPGDHVRVCVDVSGRDEFIGTGTIVGGNKGQNFIKLTNPTSDAKAESGESNIQDVSSPTSHSVPLCRSCRDSLGNKWTWNQLHAAKGIEVVCEDTLRSYVEELKMYRELGLSCAPLNIMLGLTRKSVAFPRGLNVGPSSFISFPRNEPRSSKTSKDNIPLGLQELSAPLLPSLSDFELSSKPLQPASAEEESVLSLLSLSKTPVQFNGENVSELSIESLRKLTDRLQQNGPLTEDLAKAVGEPLVNGKVALQNSPTFSNPLPSIGSTHLPEICVRCSLKGKSRKTLSIISTIDPVLAKNLDEPEIVQLYKSISEAVKQTRAVVYVIKRAVLGKIWMTVEKAKTERMAIASGQKISPKAIQRKISLRKPEQRLQRTKSEYVDALLPYATYFISRFTKRDELANAKRVWVQEMIDNYNKSKRALKQMFGSANDEARVAKEDKFFTAIDNLRKSFDIVLTKKDIKLRRQNQPVSQSSMDSPQTNFSSSTGGSSQNQIQPLAVPLAPVPKSEETITNGETTAETVSQRIPSSDESSQQKVAERPVDSGATQNVPVSLVNGNASVRMESDDVPMLQNESEAEMEILARLAQYPIQIEDVNALLRITSGEVKMDLDLKLPAETNDSANGSNSVKEVTTNCLGDEKKTESENGILNGSGGDDAMEVDDVKLLEENLSLKSTDNLEIGGDIDLINAIGTFGTSMDLKGAEDSDLLLNVFDDPVFSEPQEPTPCCSKSLTQPERNVPPKNINTGPVLAKLTPEICRGFLLDDIKAHQQCIDVQLDQVEAEIMELEKRRGKGLREKDDDKLFEMLYANMQILIYNMEVLNKITDYQIGENNPEEEAPVEIEVDEDDEDYFQPQQVKTPHQPDIVTLSESEDSSSSNSDAEELLDL